jgi:hypothetical protein
MHLYIYSILRGHACHVTIILYILYMYKSTCMHNFARDITDENSDLLIL